MKHPRTPDADDRVRQTELVNGSAGVDTKSTIANLEATIELLTKRCQILDARYQGLLTIYNADQELKRQDAAIAQA